MFAVLLSGKGRSLVNLLDHGFKKQISYVGSQKHQCDGIKLCLKNDVPIWTWSPEPPSTEELFSGGTLAPHMMEAGFTSGLPPVDLIVLAGYTSKITIPPGFENKVINIHPSLLPSFGGKGMYGMNVHKAVIESGVKFSGCTVHYVNNEYDAGPIILQRLVAVDDDETPESLASKVFKEEKIALPFAINLHLSGKLKVNGQRVSWSD